MAPRSHRQLIVWKKALALADEVYGISRELPREEQYRLTSQLLRAVVSVPANIAEGNGRDSLRDYAHFLSIARGSVLEVETLLLIAERRTFLAPAATQPLLNDCDEISRMLLALRRRLLTRP